MISSIELKKRMASFSIFGIIIGNFCYKKKLYLIILLKVDKNSKMGFYYIILPLSLVIRLWKKGNRKSLLDASKIA